MTLGELLEAIDTEVRTAAVRAHHNLMQSMEGSPLQVGDQELSGASLMPREVQQPRRISLQLTVYVKDGEASLEKRFWGSGRPAKLNLEWESTECPEALSRVRVREEDRNG